MFYGVTLYSDYLFIFFPYPKPGKLGEKKKAAREGPKTGQDCFVLPPKKLKGRTGELFVRLF